MLSHLYRPPGVPAAHQRDQETIFQYVEDRSFGSGSRSDAYRCLHRPRGDGYFEEQALVALNNLKDAVEESGCFLDNLVKTHVLMPNPANLAAYRKVELEFYRKVAPRLVEEPPATTVVHPFGLASPKFGIEVEAIAYRPMIS